MITIVTGYMNYNIIKEVIRSIKDRNELRDDETYILVGSGDEFPIMDSLPKDKKNYQFSAILNYLDDGTKRLDIAFQMLAVHHHG